MKKRASQAFGSTILGTPLAARAIDNGAPLSAVQKIIGHKTIQTTMQCVHTTDEGKRRAVQAVEAAGKLVTFWSQESAMKTG